MSGYVAPTLRAAYGQTVDATTSPVTFSVTMQAGDYIAVIAETSDSLRVVGTPSGGGLTYTLKASQVTTNWGNAYLWTAQSSTTQTFTLSVTPSGGNAGANLNIIRAYVFGGVSALGNVQQNHASTGNPSLTFTTTHDHSYVIWGSVDWNDVALGTPAYSSGASQDLAYHSTAANYFFVKNADAGTAGSYTVSITAPTGQKWSAVGIELVGTYVDNQAPTVPSGVTPTATSTTTATVSWTASTDDVGVSSYRVQRGGTTVAATVVGTSFSDSGLTSNTTYSYTVSAIDAAGNRSAESTAASVTTFGPPIVDAGADVAGFSLGAVFTRTAGENANGGTITGRTWKITAGPAGVGSTIGTTAALSWVPSVIGTYTIQYSATSAYGTTTDTAQITVIQVGTALFPGSDFPKLVVEAAWGANITTSESSWSWSDISEDVRLANGLHMQHGRSDEASTSQPATCTIVLDNTSGSYLPGGQSPLYPYVKVGTPFRVRIDPDGSGPIVVFSGQATAWTPTWDLSGKIRSTSVEISGILRRLSANTPPVFSPIRRFLTFSASSIIAYWPMEDDVKASYFAPAVGANALTWSGTTPALHNNNDFTASDSLPTLKSSTVLSANVPTSTATAYQVRFLLEVPNGDATTGGNAMNIAYIYTTGTVKIWAVQYVQGIQDGDWGFFVMTGYDAFNNVVATTGAGVVPSNGARNRVSMQFTQNGSGVDWNLNAIWGTTGYVLTGTVSNATVGTVTNITIQPNGAADGLVLGHLSVQGVSGDAFDAVSPLAAYSGETSTARIQRLTTENGIPLDLQAPTDITSSISDQMGAQTSNDLVTLLREAEQTAFGSLYDGYSFGLRYCSLRYKESQAAAIDINALVGQLAPPFQPTLDDQRIVNRATVTRTGGGSAQFADYTGPLGINVIGLYDGSLTVNTKHDANTILYAGLVVAQGTVEGYRFPAIALNLRANPGMIASAVTLRPGMRIKLRGLSSVLPHASSDIQYLMIEGIEQTCSYGQWDVVLKCSPYDIWSVAKIANTTGDSNEFVFRIAGDEYATTTTTSGSSTTTSIGITVSSGGMWTTAADDFPLSAELNGQQISVTAATAPSGSTQTLTVSMSGFVGTFPIGAPIRVYKPTRLGL